MGARKYFAHTGQRFGRGVVIDPEVRVIQGQRSVRAARLRCDCGNVYTVTLGNLYSTRRTSSSCGCVKREVTQERNRAGRVHFARPGDRFGRWTVLEVHGPAAVCACDCGTERSVTLSDLVLGKSQSCGCMAREITAAGNKTSVTRREAASRRQREHNTAIVTHGLARHPLYMTWYNMLRRCEKPDDRNYRHYGGRGIRVCDEWHDLAQFIYDIGRILGPRPDGMTLDRYPDNDGNYEPSNVRWATDDQQAENRRTPRVGADDVLQVRAMVNAGRSYTEVSGELGIAVHTVARIARGECYQGVTEGAHDAHTPLPSR